ncbi:MAG: hypothetical protein Q9214_006831 [Letrouitia sp. 1 TL-2023]
MQAQIAAGQDTAALSADLTTLLASGWALDSDHITLQKTYRFKTYTKDFHNTIGVRSKAKNHHPEMISVRPAKPMYNLLIFG